METTDHLFESIHSVYLNKSRQNTNIPSTTVGDPVPSNTQISDGIWVANIKYRILSNTAKYYMGTSFNPNANTNTNTNPNPKNRNSGKKLKKGGKNRTFRIRTTKHPNRQMAIRCKLHNFLAFYSTTRD